MENANNKKIGNDAVNGVDDTERSPHEGGLDDTPVQGYEEVEPYDVGRDPPTELLLFGD